MLGLLLLQVLSSCLWLGHGEVVNSFASCPQFFYRGTFPNDVLEPQNAAYICQHYSNSYRFATLYDRDRRIPVYSAYKYQPGSGKRPHTWSFVEPQLIGNNSLKDMEREWDLRENHSIPIDQIKESQAVLEDYEKAIFWDRGSLSPSGHQDDTDSKTATFTLTNTVPMDSYLYTDQWYNYESEILPNFSKDCTTTYVITGAVPGNINISDNRVNVPHYIWSAACCLNGIEPMKGLGFIANNENSHKEKLKLGELEDKLSTLYSGRTVTLFDNACPRQGTSRP
uniref:ENDD1 protein n=1 Tax=Zosterops lateralis melanops TaxID=1220523 RepID=A0A8D2PAJ9_ZOSLA